MPSINFLQELNQYQDTETLALALSQIQLPPALQQFTEFIEGINGKCFLHGGAVRDLLLSFLYGFEMSIRDYDTLIIISQQIFNQIIESKKFRLTKPYEGRDLFYLHSEDGDQYEIAFICVNKKLLNNMEAINYFLYQSAYGRDITINALFAKISDGKICLEEIFDFFNGYYDLKNFVIKTVITPRMAFGQKEINKKNKSYQEMRILNILDYTARCYEYHGVAWSFSFMLHDEIYGKELQSSSTLKKKLYKTFTSGYAVISLNLLEFYGYARQIFPYYDQIKEDLKNYLAELDDNDSLISSYKLFTQLLLFSFRQELNNENIHFPNPNNFFLKTKIVFTEKEQKYILSQWEGSFSALNKLDEAEILILQNTNEETSKGKEEDQHTSDKTENVTSIQNAINDNEKEEGPLTKEDIKNVAILNKVEQILQSSSEDSSEQKEILPATLNKVERPVEGINLPDFIIIGGRKIYLNEQSNLENDNVDVSKNRKNVSTSNMKYIRPHKKNKTHNNKSDELLLEGGSKKSRFSILMSSLVDFIAHFVSKRRNNNDSKLRAAEKNQRLFGQRVLKLRNVQKSPAPKIKKTMVKTGTTKESNQNSYFIFLSQDPPQEKFFLKIKPIHLTSTLGMVLGWTIAINPSRRSTNLLVEFIVSFGITVIGDNLYAHYLKSKNTQFLPGPIRLKFFDQDNSITVNQLNKIQDYTNKSYHLINQAIQILEKQNKRYSNRNYLTKWEFQEDPNNRLFHPYLSHSRPIYFFVTVYLIFTFMGVFNLLSWAGITEKSEPDSLSPFFVFTFVLSSIAIADHGFAAANEPNRELNTIANTLDEISKTLNTDKLTKLEEGKTVASINDSAEKIIRSSETMNNKIDSLKESLKSFKTLSSDESNQITMQYNLHEQLN